MLEPGVVALPGGEDGDPRRPRARRRAPRRPGRRAAPAPRPTGRRGRPRTSSGQRGAGAVAVGECVAEAGRHLEVVGGGHPAAGGGAEQVDRGHRGAGLAGPGLPHGVGLAAGAVRDRPLRQHAGPHDLGRAVGVTAPATRRAVGVGEEGVERAVPLLHAGGGRRPVGRRDDARDRVQREGPHGLPAVRPGRDGHPTGVPLDGHARSRRRSVPRSPAAAAPARPRRSRRAAGRPCATASSAGDAG